MTSNIEMLVERAKNGDREALSELIGRIQDRIYGLAIRMLRDPADAEDATQEIIVKIATHLGDFKEQSAFLSWIFKIASNHLLTTSNHEEAQSRTPSVFPRAIRGVYRSMACA